jgi:hypothetical protein
MSKRKEDQGYRGALMYNFILEQFDVSDVSQKIPECLKIQYF